MENNIKDIFDTFLGEPKRDYAGSGGWYEYNCPSCKEENCGEPDDKYNLAVNYEIGSENGLFMHCWKCDLAGSLSRLLRLYGNPELYKKYKDAIKEFFVVYLF